MGGASSKGQSHMNDSDRASMLEELETLVLFSDGLERQGYLDRIDALNRPEPITNLELGGTVPPELIERIKSIKNVPYIAIDPRYPHGYHIPCPRCGSVLTRFTAAGCRENWECETCDYNFDAPIPPE